MLLKGLRATALKERIEIRRVINNLREADHLLYKSLWENVEKRHKVTRAVREESKLIDKLWKSANNSYNFVFNLSTEDMQLLKTIEDILKELESFSRSVGRANSLKNIEKQLALTMYEALKKAESEDREAFKQVMLIINEAAEEDPNAFMAKIRLAFQQEAQQTFLAKFAARAEIRSAKISILRLQKIPGKIRHLKDKLTKAKKGAMEEVIGELSNLLQEIKKHCTNAFKEMFYLKKRISLLTLKILLNLNNLRKFNLRWADKHYMPAGLIKEKNDKIDEIEGKIAKEFHTIAQAFRIVITKIQRLEKEAAADASV